LFVLCLCLCLFKNFKINVKTKKKKQNKIIKIKKYLKMLDLDSMDKNMFVYL